MKKLSLVLAFILVLSCGILAACGGDETSNASSSEAASSEASVSSEEPSANESSDEAEPSEEEPSEEAPSEDESSEEEPSEEEPSEEEPSEEEPSDVSSENSQDEPVVEPAPISGNVVSGGKSYEVAGGEGFIVASGQYPANYSASLTDGEAAEDLDFSNNSWNALCITADDDGEANIIDGVGTIIVDLEAAANITGVKVHLGQNADASIAYPLSLVASVSSDKASWTELGELTWDDSDIVAWAEIGVTGVEGQYVKLEFTCNTAVYFCFVNEIEVYAA